MTGGDSQVASPRGCRSRSYVKRRIPGRLVGQHSRVARAVRTSSTTSASDWRARCQVKSKGTQPAPTSLFWRVRSVLCGSAATDGRLRRGNELIDGPLGAVGEVEPIIAAGDRDLDLPLRERQAVAPQDLPEQEFEFALSGGKCRCPEIEDASQRCDTGPTAAGNLREAVLHSSDGGQPLVQRPLERGFASTAVVTTAPRSTSVRVAVVQRSPRMRQMSERARSRDRWRIRPGVFWGAVGTTVISGRLGRRSMRPSWCAALRWEAAPPVNKSPAAKSPFAAPTAPATRYTPTCARVSCPMVRAWSICRSLRPHAINWARVTSPYCSADKANSRWIDSSTRHS